MPGEVLRGLSSKSLRRSLLYRGSHLETKEGLIKIDPESESGIIFDQLCLSG